MSPYYTLDGTASEKIRKHGPKVGFGLLKVALRVGVMLVTGGIVDLPI